ncbi:hypothetical protein A9W98_06645 [Mycobacterium gordonae]|uniref:Uncharacterized protein n=2 Tax=Mycobacterium TaxID=1763 RepID=A0ABY3V7M5_MYCLN|nr:MULTISPECIES: hypothetical protein [Mycobacterium]OBS04038.1 hypothetical protein A9W98_06645 [Mycobacterium gordonae]ULP45620.1 hypothetical protein MJO58_28600 [Mycobacterium lentiflavum]
MFCELGVTGLPFQRFLQPRPVDVARRVVGGAQRRSLLVMGGGNTIKDLGAGPAARFDRGCKLTVVTEIDCRH